MLRILVLASLLLPAAAFARDWQVDSTKSALTFKGSYQNEAFDGTFKSFDATIVYDVANLSASKFDVSVDLATAGTGNGDRDDSLKGSDFFDVKKSPKAHFVTGSFARSADGGVEAKGSLTLHGQTKPVTLNVKFVENGSAATLDVDTVLKRADFGLGAGSDWSDVGADVTVHGHLVLTAK
ncbi:MAG: YceI family protein [Dokdonella sp.]|uniref:YceI family protein n=1 Tax=Dokdonella sp. TaxID=2291710 RepID=UPI0032651925